MKKILLTFILVFVFVPQISFVMKIDDVIKTLSVTLYKCAIEFKGNAISDKTYIHSFTTYATDNKEALRSCFEKSNAQPTRYGGQTFISGHTDTASYFEIIDLTVEKL